MSKLNQLFDKIDIAEQNAASFLVPQGRNLKVSDKFAKGMRVVALIPTHSPKTITYKLTKNLLKWYPSMKVIVIDDCTPKLSKNYETIKKIKRLGVSYKNFVYLRTDNNSLKAGALNYGLDYVKVALDKKPNVVLTLDDDVIITRKTVPTMIKSLYSEVEMGAVCTLAKVRNKNSNVLTRLQAFEYHNFNVTKIADNGFLKGPLVMPGMLTAFRYAAIADVAQFTTGHLIEDYDLTAKLKLRDWKVGIAKDSSAWTDVPETMGALWKQRVRWTLGGLTVVKDYWKNTIAVFQDLVGHLLFISLFVFIATSFIFACRSCEDDPILVVSLMALSVVNFLAANSFNLLTFLSFPRRDKTDWLLKLMMVPEFAYSNFMTLVLLGSYMFFTYTQVVGKLAEKVKALEKLYRFGLDMFSKAGYTFAWGTKAITVEALHIEDSFVIRPIGPSAWRGGEI